MLSADSKVIGIAIEHRNPINQSADFVVWKEGKTRIYRNGEISRGSAVLEGTIHVIQGLYVNCGRTCIFCVKGRYARQPKEERLPPNWKYGLDKKVSVSFLIRKRK